MPRRTLPFLCVLCIAGCETTQVADRDASAPVDQSIAEDASGDMATCAYRNTNCPLSAPICSSSTDQCRPCVDPADETACANRSDGHPHCGSTGACVECRTDADCPIGNPVCDTNQTCRPCVSTGDCPDSVCILTGARAGQCAFGGTEVAWVDNTNMTLCMNGNGLKPSSPYCDIDKAIINLGLPYIHVAGSTIPYPAVTQLHASTTNIGPLQISGPGIGASPSARVFTVGADSFGISSTGAGSVSIVLEGLEMGGDSTSKGRYGLEVANAGTGNIDVTVTGCLIHDNYYGGVNLPGPTNYVIVNTFIVRNGDLTMAGPAVQLGNAATGVFAFNTVAENLSAGILSGIDCGASPKTIEGSIVTMNGSVGGGGMLGPTCNALNIVLAGVDFVSTTDFHLDISSPSSQAANAACCIDKITSDPGTPLKNVDVNGTIRPKGNGWDIGAHEVQ